MSNKTVKSRNNKSVTITPAGNSEAHTKLTALREAAAKIESDIAAEAASVFEATKKLIAGLPNLLGVSNHSEVISLIKQHNKLPAKARTVLTPEVKAAILADLVAKAMTGDEIAAKHKISLPSVMKVKSENGLVKKRTPKAVAAAA